MPKYYPGWVMRLYIDYDFEDPIFKELCHLACQPQYSNLDICQMKQLPSIAFKDIEKIFPMNWRFLPTLDLQVPIFLISLNHSFILYPLPDCFEFRACLASRCLCSAKT